MCAFSLMEKEQKFGKDGPRSGANNNFNYKSNGFYKIFRFGNFETFEIIMTSYDTER